MKSLFYFPLLLLIACSSSKGSAKKASAYQYDGTQGKCLNKDGKEGYNPLGIKSIQKTKDCECVDLGELDLITLLADVPKGQEFSYNELIEYNFRGANMSRTSIHFNYLLDCDFSGADMGGIQYGYAIIAGKRDKFTVPPKGCPSIGDNEIDCAN